MTIVPVPIVGAAMILEPIDALISEAMKYRFVREDTGNNRSIHIDYWNYEAINSWEQFPIGGKGAPWCASFVQAAGRQALGHAWPVPRTASVQSIVDWAQPKSLLFDDPEVGDFVVLFYPNLSPPRFGHIGIVQAVVGNTVRTIEGNTNDGGSREGYGVFERNRTVSGRTKFVRWIQAL